MTGTKEQIIERRRNLRAQYKSLYDEAAALLFRHDPMGINFEDNTDEYEPEVGTILPRLRECSDESQVCSVIHEEFGRWFGLFQAGPRGNYELIASEMWALWQKHHAT